MNLEKIEFHISQDEKFPTNEMINQKEIITATKYPLPLTKPGVVWFGRNCEAFDNLLILKILNNNAILIGEECKATIPAAEIKNPRET